MRLGMLSIAVTLVAVCSFSLVNPIDIDSYIEEVSQEAGIDPDIPRVILAMENPKLDEQYININTNGTIDLGLWQLNSKYLWSDFVKKFWHSEETFNPFNWKHSTYVAIYQLKFLQDNLNTVKQIIMAYNCGLGAVKHNRIPSSSIKYADKAFSIFWQ